MLYRIVLVSAKHQHESAICIHTSPLLLKPYLKSLLNLFNSSNLSVCLYGYRLHLCIIMSSEDNSHFFLPNPDHSLLHGPGRQFKVPQNQEQQALSLF